MPITYAQPEPFSPSIASAYGAAQQFSQDAPTIAGLAEHTASLQQQGLGRADQLRFAYAQANAQAREQDANRYAAGQVHQADREQQGMNLGAQLEAQATGQMLHANTQLLAQQQGAQLQAWLGQQDLSQKEAMRLQQMQGAVADIQASSLPDDQKQASILQLKTGIDGYKQRLQASQARDTEAQATQRSAEAAKLTRDGVEAEKFWSSSAQDRNTPVYDKRVLAQVAAEVQQMQEDGRLGVMTPQERDQFIKDEVAQREGGLLGHEHRLGAGKSEFIPHTKTDAGAKGTSGTKGAGKEEHPSGLSPNEYRKEYSETVRRVEKIADAEKELKDENGNPYWNRKKIGEAVEKDMTELHHLPANFEEYHKLTPKTTTATREPFGGRFKPPPPPSPEETKKMAEAGSIVEQSKNELQARQDVAPNVKDQMLTAFDAAQQMIDDAAAKGRQLTDAEKKTILQFGRAYESLGKPPQAATQPPPQPQSDAGVPWYKRSSSGLKINRDFPHGLEILRQRLGNLRLTPSAGGENPSPTS